MERAEPLAGAPRSSLRYEAITLIDALRCVIKAIINFRLTIARRKTSKRNLRTAIGAVRGHLVSGSGRRRSSRRLRVCRRRQGAAKPWPPAGRGRCGVKGGRPRGRSSGMGRRVYPTTPSSPRCRNCSRQVGVTPSDHGWSRHRLRRRSRCPAPPAPAVAV